MFRNEMHENAKGHLCPTGRLRLATLASWVMRITSHDWSRCHVRQLRLCCTSRAICGEANQPQLTLLFRDREIRYSESQTVPADAVGERESLFDARHHDRSRLTYLLDVSEAMFGSRAMVNSLCYVVAIEIIRQAEIH